jgi:hypothetical protein
MENTVETISHWISVKEYARQARIQTRSVHIRFRRGVITGAIIDDMLVLDNKLGVPVRKLPYKPPRAPKFVWPPSMPPIRNMVRVSNFCEINHIRGHDLYRDILLGKIMAWHFADHIFIENSPALKVYTSNGRRPKWSPRK